MGTLAKREYVVKSVLKALDILELLDSEPGLGVTEVAGRLDMEKSTAFRLLNSLRLRGYVRKDPESHRYSNGFRLFEMGNNVVKNLGLKEQAFPFLQELSKRTGEAVNLAIRDGKDVVYIDKIESQATIKVDLHVGKRMPMYCTGLGKVLLAFMDPGEVKEFYSGEVFEQYTPNTHKNLASLLDELERIRKQGYALDNEEYVQDLVCIAAPVLGTSGDVVAALSVALPKFRYDAYPERYEEIRDHVIEVAGSLSMALKGTAQQVF
ncbi:MAG: IclR family transcriptional regulator [Thermovirgaceae bacterium]